MTLTTVFSRGTGGNAFQMPVRSMTLTTVAVLVQRAPTVSDACQINDFDHRRHLLRHMPVVSDACQINDFDHPTVRFQGRPSVSDACQINDFDHHPPPHERNNSFRCLSDQ